MKHLKEALVMPIVAISQLYRPVATPGFGGNLRCALGSALFAPRIFISPVLFAFGLFLKQPGLDRFGVFILSLLHLAAFPILMPYFLSLPFLGRRIYLHTPAARALAQIKRQIQAQQEADAG